MSVASPRIRRLRAEERALIIEMARHLPELQALLHGIDDAVVEDMNDGGMGSLKFVDIAKTKARLPTRVREATFLDVDGMSVSITLNVDQDGDLFELDVFKADGSRLKRFPSPGDVSLR